MVQQRRTSVAGMPHRRSSVMERQASTDSNHPMAHGEEHARNTKKFKLSEMQPEVAAAIMLQSAYRGAHSRNGLIIQAEARRIVKKQRRRFQMCPRLVSAAISVQQQDARNLEKIASDARGREQLKRLQGRPLLPIYTKRDLNRGHTVEILDKSTASGSTGRRRSVTVRNTSSLYSAKHFNTTHWWNRQVTEIDDSSDESSSSSDEDHENFSGSR